MKSVTDQKQTEITQLTSKNSTLTTQLQSKTQELQSRTSEVELLSTLNQKQESQIQSLTKSLFDLKKNHSQNPQKMMNDDILDPNTTFTTEKEVNTSHMIDSESQINEQKLQNSKENCLLFQNIQFDNGYYSGYCKNGIKQGRGQMKYKNGNLYSGEWENNAYHGYGTLKLQNGDMYQGTWQNGKQNGYCIAKLNNGNQIEGFLDNGKLYKGKYIRPTGSVYEGEFKENQQNGKGRFTFPNGDKFEGNFKNNTFHGQGIYTLVGIKEKRTYDGGKLLRSEKNIDQITI